VRRVAAGRRFSHPEEMLPQRNKATLPTVRNRGSAAGIPACPRERRQGI